MDEPLTLADPSSPLRGLRRPRRGRLTVVSNRVAPITEGEPTNGGLAAGVLDALSEKGGLWFGWSGETTEGETVAQPERRRGEIRLMTFDLSQRDYDEYYRGFANGALWPVLHDKPHLARFEWEEFAGYKRVNALFARALAANLSPEDPVWVHDYHLFCLAEALRAEGVGNRLGFFLHTPFPAPSVFMTIPAHAELARALCRFDLIGFQTEASRMAFEDYILREAGGRRLPSGRLAAFGRAVQTGVYPIGVDVDEVRRQAEAEANRRQAARLGASLGGGKLILSVDRLDYSKGLKQRFAAFEQFLETRPEYHGTVTFVQIAPPSRSDIETYREIRTELEGEAGRINGRFAELDWMPLHYLNKGFARHLLMPLYALAEVGLVTPLKDGMNLVAKEYVAAQDPENPGVLVLSQFAGAAAELDAALLVNPYDRTGVAEAIARGLAMALPERRERHAAMIAALRRNSLERWRDRFLEDLAGEESAIPYQPAAIVRAGRSGLAQWGSAA
ncbi:MAG TPA: trehalose-6-phosphate synthase [Acetobacteraceae bacterium]|nr:trehalose-6-phosphate synthase [Acetobacteraceae bacterium]